MRRAEEVVMAVLFHSGEKEDIYFFTVVVKNFLRNIIKSAKERGESCHQYERSCRVLKGWENGCGRESRRGACTT